jgi:hypothetical protein
MKDIESLFDFRGIMLPLLVFAAVCRGSREVEVDGDERICETEDLGVVPSSLITPNSEVATPVGDGLAEVGARPLARLVVEGLRGDEGLADAALEMRGILVGVSLGKPETVLREESEGSRCPLVMVPTEGEPAIVGSWLRLRSEVSDRFCIELTV